MMNRSRSLPLVALLALVMAGHALHAPPVRGQSVEPALSAPHPYGVFLKFGLEPQLVVSLGYVHRLDTQESASGAGIGIGLKVPPYGLGTGSGRLSLIAAGHWLPNGGWGSAATAQAFVVRGQNRAGTIHGLGLEVRAAPGYYDANWRVAADVGWQGTLLAHIRHSAAAKDTFEERYPDSAADSVGPVSGWYGSTAHRFRVGVSGMRAVSDHTLLKVSVGSLVSVQNQGILLGFAHGQVPAYFETSLHFGRTPVR